MYENEEGQTQKPHSFWNFRYIYCIAFTDIIHVVEDGYAYKKESDSD